jgi:DNA-binding NarL/FixJ family response regulator
MRSHYRDNNEEDTVRKLRVLLAVDSPLVRDALRRRLDREEDVCLAGEAADPVDLLMAVRSTGANVVIHSWPRSREIPGICSHLLAEYPDLLIIAIPSDSDRIVTCRQTITVSEFQNAGVENVLSELRRAGATSERVLA